MTSSRRRPHSAAAPSQLRAAATVSCLCVPAQPTQSRTTSPARIDANVAAVAWRSGLRQDPEVTRGRSIAWRGYGRGRRRGRGSGCSPRPLGTNGRPVWGSSSYDDPPGVGRTLGHEGVTAEHEAALALGSLSHEDLPAYSEGTDDAPGFSSAHVRVFGDRAERIETLVPTVSKTTSTNPGDTKSSSDRRAGGSHGAAPDGGRARGARQGGPTEVPRSSHAVFEPARCTAIRSSCSSARPRRGCRSSCRSATAGCWSRRSRSTAGRR